MTASTNPYCATVLAALLDDRTSCRGFRPEPLPRETIVRLLGHAQRTASWCNAQPWKIHLLGGAALEQARATLPDYANGHPAQPDLPWPAAYRGVYLERRRECGFRLYEAVGVGRGDRSGAARQGSENYRFFGAPHVALVTTDRDLGVYGAIDCGAWVSTFMLAARAAGVATIAQAALASHPGFWRERLGLGADRLLVCGVSFGYAEENHPANAFRTSRAALADVVQWIDEPTADAQELQP
jgi:nitroreductase